MHGARYGEVLLVTGRLNQIEETVYNTLGLNDSPDDLWQALATEAIKKTYRARAVILNGPRYFLMDKVSIVDPGEEIFDFGGAANAAAGDGALAADGPPRRSPPPALHRATSAPHDRLCLGPGPGGL